MTDQDWELVYRVHIYGAYKVTKAAWDYFQKQQYGRIIMTSSAAGLYGNYGQANYGSAKLGLVGFGETLAKEGSKKNIHCNIIAPVAGSRITETVLPPELIAKLKPDYVAPFVAYLCHEECTENGAIYEVGAGFAARVRWERSSGILLNVNHEDSFTPSAVAAALPRAQSFPTGQVEYPQSMGDVDWVQLVQKSKSQPAPNPQTSPSLRFEGRVVLVTGAGGGLGRAYAILFAQLGATLIVNDPGRKGADRLADTVVEEIRRQKLPGMAIANYDSVTEGATKMIDEIVARHGRLDVLVNNAGILRDKSFTKMTEEEWQAVLSVHLHGTYHMCKAAWPHFLRQKYGRIINTSSAVGLYGNFGQANYSCAKAAILGLSSSLAAEGQKHNILVNTIAPNAGTQMTATILPGDVVALLRPDYVAPFVGYLAHEECKVNGAVWEVGSGWMAPVRRQRSAGYKLKEGLDLLEEVKENWKRFGDFSIPERTVYPKNAQESFSSIVALLSQAKNDTQFGENNIKKRESSHSKGTTREEEEEGGVFSFTKRDVMLYNLGVGCSEKELRFVYEGAINFAPLPTFGVIPAFIIMMNTKMEELVNGFNPTQLLHGEHYLEIIKPLPVEGKLRSEAHVLQVLAKGEKGSVIVLQLKTFDKDDKLVAINEGTIFLRGTTPRRLIDRGTERRPLASQTIVVPSERPPDANIKQTVAPNQAAIYRLSGDYNPLHIDGNFAKMGGFPQPILHGLCTFGYATHHVIQAFGEGDPTRIKAIKGRFTRHVFPGETIQTEMWKVSPQRIVFQVRVLERNEIVLGNAFIELHSPTGIKAEPSSEVMTNKSGVKAEPIFARYRDLYSKLPLSMKEEQVKKVNGIFQFDIKDGAGQIHSFHIDLKNGSGTIGEGKVDRPDITIIVKDEDFVKLAGGKLNGQQAFMKGLVQVRGNMMLAMKLDRVLKTLSSPSSKL